MTGDGALAWSVLRCSGDYRAAWRAHAAPPAYEDGAPFPVRIRTEADRAAEAPWGLLAWSDPDGGSASAFFAEAPMLDGTGAASAPPLLPLLADAGASVEGLRLCDGALMLKVCIPTAEGRPSRASWPLKLSGGESRFATGV